MEYHPQVRSPTVHDEEVPYFCDESSPYRYKNTKDWILWPETAGMWGPWNAMTDQDARISRLPWEFNNWDFSLYNQCDPRNTAAFIQSWLSVGLLSDVLQKDAAVVERNYVHLKAGKRIFSTSQLDIDLAIMTFDLGLMEDAAQTNRVSAISSVIEHAKKVIMSLHPDSDRLDACPLPPIAILAIEIMIDTILHALRWTRIPIIPPWNNNISHVIKSLLRSQKFCPSDITWIQNTFSPSTQYFLSKLGPRSSDRDHYHCKEGDCLAMLVVKEDYKVIHRPSCNGACSVSGIDGGRLSEILSAGCSAVMQYDDATTLELSNPATQTQTSLKALPSSEVENYVAISHVWSDGLGNPERNEIPTCQLSWLASLVREILPVGERINFWLDTLCVPTGEDHRDSRKKAISLIGESYKNATAVLVLDKQCYTRPQGASDTETLGRVLLSNWRRRLWTLMEAISAKKLIVAFSSALIVLEDIQEKVVGEWVRQLTVVEHGLQLEIMRSGLYPGSLPVEKIVSIYDWVQNRATSHKEDEITCIAVMMGFTPEKMQVVLSAPVPDRYLSFLQEVVEFPISFCFIDVPRLNVDRFRWCPRDFITRDEDGYLISQPPVRHRKDSRMGVMHPWGLQFSSDGFLFELPEPETAKHERPTVVISHPNQDLRSVLFFEEHHEARWRKIIGSENRSAHSQFAVILSSKAPAKADGSGVFGAIVSILKKKDIIEWGENVGEFMDNVCYAQFIMTCHIGAVSATDWLIRWPGKAFSKGGPMKKDQAWIVN